MARFARGGKTVKQVVHTSLPQNVLVGARE